MLRKVLYLGFLIISNAGCYRVMEEMRCISYDTPIYDFSGKKIYCIKKILYTRDILPAKSFAKEETQYKVEYYFLKSNPAGEDTVTLRIIFKEDEYTASYDTSYTVYLGDISPFGEILGWRNRYPYGITILDTLGKRTKLVIEWGKNPRWVSNYTKIVFEGDTMHSGIWIMNKDGTGLHKILDGGDIEAVSDISEKLIFSTNYGKTLCIYSFADGSVDTIIPNFENLVPGIDFSIAADWIDKDTIIWIETPTGYPPLEEDTLAIWIYSIESDTLVQRIFIEDHEDIKEVPVIWLKYSSITRSVIFQDLYGEIWKVQRDGTGLKRILKREVIFLKER